VWVECRNFYLRAPRNDLRRWDIDVSLFHITKKYFNVCGTFF
jgi:hypothetical protein